MNPELSLNSFFNQCVLQVQVDRVNHDAFSYNFGVLSSANGNVQATFRVFLAPKKDENGQPIPLAEQRRLFIEMDKFVETSKTKVF